LSKKRILWIPHAPWSQCKAQRPWHLIRGLAERYELHVVTWAGRPAERGRLYYLNPLNHLRALAARTTREDFGYLHNAGVPLPLAQFFNRGYPPQRTLAFSQWRFQKNIRRLHRQWKFDAVVASSSHHYTGYPPPLPGVPRIFDYVDISPPQVEAHFVSSSDRIVCVSHFLQRHVRDVCKKESVWIPNGLRLDRVLQGNRERGRARWGLEGKKVVSLIGLTCSDRLYFLDALAALKSEVPGLVFVGAGSGAMAARIAARAKELSLPAVMTGWVEPDDVPDLFAASDVGLYPGDDNVYYDGACPLKVLEYAGAGVPVVANRTAELNTLNLDAVILCPASAEEFAPAIRAALHHPRSKADLSSFDWPLLIGQFADEIERALVEKS
jgi:glycosyltransferase involved in cell wall biosynthesis